MSDLYEHYIFTEKAAVPYYIGALSCVYQNNRYDLIDGQQRMTVMALIGIAFNNYSKNPKKIEINNCFALTFYYTGGIIKTI